MKALQYTWRKAASDRKFDPAIGFIGQQIYAVFPRNDQPGVPHFRGQGIVIGQVIGEDDVKALCVIQVRDAETAHKKRFNKSDLFLPAGYIKSDNRKDGIAEASTVYVLPYSKEFIPYNAPFIRHVQPDEIAALVEARAYALLYVKCTNPGMAASEIEENWHYLGPVFDAEEKFKVVQKYENGFTPDVRGAIKDQLDLPNMGSASVLEFVRERGYAESIMPQDFFPAARSGRDPFRYNPPGQLKQTHRWLEKPDHNLG